MAAPRKALELFLSLSVSTGAVLAPFSPAAAAPAEHHGHSTNLDEGGEGGEGGEGQRAIESELDLLVVLEQMRGHLLIAEELLASNDPSGAEPHVGHPIDELYGAVDAPLQQRQIPGFKSQLEDLRQQVRLNAQPALVQAKLTAARQGIQQAELALAPLRLSSPQAISVARSLALVAASEYTAAEAGGQIVETIEYQDARGFLLAAAAVIQGALAQPDAERSTLSRAQNTLQAMLRAVPSATPPQRIGVTPLQLQSLADQL
jgi:hypothetical protein